MTKSNIPISIPFPCFDSNKTAIPLASAMGLGADITARADGDRFIILKDTAPNYWKISNLDNADILIYPHNYSDSDETRWVSEQARLTDRPCLFFDGGDQSTPRVLPYGRVYRTSIYKKKITTNEHALPALCDDITRQASDLLPTKPTPQKSQRPVVGFCGYVGSRVHHLICQYTGKTEKVLGLKLRYRALRLLHQANGVDCRFLARRRFFGGAFARTGKHAINLKVRETVVREFVENMWDSDYTLCVRGKGNFSYRFYQTLSAGRIPLFVNTDCSLPFEDEIDYRKHCVWIEENNLAQIGQQLNEFHHSMSADEFEQLKIRNRLLWQKLLRIDMFYRKIIREAVAEPKASRIDSTAQSKD